MDREREPSLVLSVGDVSSDAEIKKSLDWMIKLSVNGSSVFREGHSLEQYMRIWSSPEGLGRLVKVGVSLNSLRDIAMLSPRAVQYRLGAYDAVIDGDLSILSGLSAAFQVDRSGLEPWLQLREQDGREAWLAIVRVCTRLKARYATPST